MSAVLDAHGCWSALPGFITGVTEFRTHVAAIVKQAQVQSSKTGATAEKALALHKLGDTAYEVAAAVYACAVATGNSELAGRIKHSWTEVTQGRDPVVVARCQNIHAAATEYLASLGNYGVTAAKLTALEEQLETFQTLQPKPRTNRTAMHSATQELRKAFDAADGVLDRQLDRLIVQFKIAEPDFCNQFAAARRLVNLPGVRTTAQNVVAVDTAPAEELPKAA